MHRPFAKRRHQICAIGTTPKPGLSAPRHHSRYRNHRSRFEERRDRSVTGVYGGLQQPSIPIPANVTRLTGITDAMVLGQMIDMPAVRALIEPEDPIIAHNPGFDRPFCEAFSHFSPQGLGLLEF